MLNDIARYREAMERRERRPLPESVVASRWREEVFEPTIALGPRATCGRRCRPPRCSTRCSSTAGSCRSEAGKDVGIDEAVASYVESELPRCRRSASCSKGRPEEVEPRQVYRTPDERFDGLPGYDFAPHYVEQDGLRMHYLDEGGRAPMLLLSWRSGRRGGYPLPGR